MAGDKKVSVIIAAVDQVTSRLGSIQRSISSFAGIAARRIKEGLVGLAGRALSGFFTKAIGEATEAELTMGRLAGAVERLGVPFGTVRPEIDATIRRLTALSGRDGDEVSDALANLATKSKNLGWSMSNLPLVLDLAAKEQISLGAASDIVANAMNGNMRGLRQLGIEAGSSTEAVAKLRAQYGGFAEREGNTFQGLLGRLREGWNNVLEEVGKAIIGHEGVTSSMGRVVGALGRLALWIERNRGEIGYWSTVTIAALRAVAINLANSFRNSLSLAELVGAGFKKLFYSVAVSVAQSLNAIPVAINGMIEAANKLPGIDIRVRMPELGGQIAAFGDALDEADVRARNAMRNIAGSVRSTLDAWVDVGRTAVAESQRVAEAADTTDDAAARMRAGAERMAAIVAAEAARQRAEEEARQRGRDQRAGPAVRPGAGRAAHVDLLGQAVELGIDQQNALNELRARERDLETQLRATNLHLADRVRLTQELLRIRAAQGGAEAGPAAPAIAGEIGLPPVTGEDLAASAAAGLDGTAAAAAAARESVEGLGATLGDIAGGALGTFVGTWQEGMQAIADGSQSVGQAVLSSTRKAIAGGVQAKGQETMIDAGKALAEGLRNPVHFLRAGKLFASASAYFGLASALGGGGGGGSRGGGGGGRAAAQRDSEAIANMSPRRGTIIIQGGLLNMDDPRQRRELKEAIQALGETRDIDVVVSR